MKNRKVFCTKCLRMRPRGFMRSYKYQLFNFLLHLKTAFTKLAHIRVHEFSCFLYFGQVSNAFQQKQNFGSSFECFSTKTEFRVKLRMLFNKDRNAVKFRMLFTKIDFHLSNICDLFSHIRSMVNYIIELSSLYLHELMI